MQTRARYLACTASLLVSFTWASSASPQTSDAQATDAELKKAIEELEKRIDALESELEEKNAEDSEDDASAAEDAAAPVDLTEDEPVDLTKDEPVDLTEDELTAIDGADDHVLARPWERNIHFSGFGAVGFVDSGEDGTRSNGGFWVKEASLFIDATAWENVFFFFEVQVNRLGQDAGVFVRPGEVHAHLRNVLERWGDDLLSLKIGRVDIPFGEEYLWQDASDNPLISTSAAYPYGFDEGIVAYGTLKGVGWIAAITDGTDERSLEDNVAKALNLKVYRDLSDSLYFSASFMRNGMAGKSAFEFGGSHFQPVGASHESSVGNSPSAEVGAHLFELDAKYRFGDRGYISSSFGRAYVEDDGSTFDRDITWFSIEPNYRLSPSTYAVLRYSEIGTYDAGEGYHFDGKTTAGGNSSFGYDTRRFQRLSFGLGWRPNPRTTLKVELGHDWFGVIDPAPFQPEDDGRFLTGFELVLSF